jgi:hypothetical protein
MLASLRFMFGRGRYGRRGFLGALQYQANTVRRTDAILVLDNLEPIYGLCRYLRGRMCSVVVRDSRWRGGGKL